MTATAGQQASFLPAKRLPQTAVFSLFTFFLHCASFYVYGIVVPRCGYGEKSWIPYKGSRCGKVAQLHGGLASADEVCRKKEKKATDKNKHPQIGQHSSTFSTTEFCGLQSPWGLWKVWKHSVRRSKLLVQAVILPQTLCREWTIGLAHQFKLTLLG